LKILIDDEIFLYQRFGGVSRIFTEIIKSVKSNKDYDLNFSCLYSENEYLQNESFVKLPAYLENYNFPLKGKIIRGITKAISHPKVIGAIKNNSIDLFHPTFYSDYYLKELNANPNIKFVFTVHDLIHELSENNKHYSQIADIKRRNLLRANHIIVVSENTKKDLLKFYPFVDEKKVSVNYLSQSLPATEELIDDLPDKYILFVGVRDGYKNFEVLANAFSKIKDKYPGISLFCTGSAGFSSSEKSKFTELGIQNLVIHKKLTDAQLKYAYRKAKMFVFPSKYEGFGMPILEAFYSKTPVILSNSSCLPEIGAEAALYFNPTNEQELQAQIETILNNESLRKELTEKGLQRVKIFSWQKHVEETLRIYEMLIK